MDISFSKLTDKVDAPMDLLLLANPSERLVKQYLDKGECYTARLNEETVGVALVCELTCRKASCLRINLKGTNASVKKDYIISFCH